MDTRERRRHLRCRNATEISYSLFNAGAPHAALAKNYSRFGMYFESLTALAPGAYIVIRTTGCGAADETGAEGGAAPYYCRTPSPANDPCREVKTLVAARVKRCVPLAHADGPAYGIAVHYIEPAV